MSTLVVDPNLYERVEKVALEQNSNVNDILAEAIRYYLWELDRRKISEESKVYRQRHTELKAQYLGHYIAMYNGQVVDQDTDFQILYRRVRQRFQHTPVMMTLVEEVVDRPLARRGFRMRGDSP